MPIVDDVGLEFFNRLSGELEIELTEAPERIADLANLAAPPTARLVSVALRLEVFEDDDFRPLTADELGRVVLRTPRIRMRSYQLEKVVVEHEAPAGARFTVADLGAAVEATERRTRGDTEWFGGIDVHHIFFEGIELGDDGVWMIWWGS